MKIKDINSLDLSKVTLKLSANSITVRQNNKTKAVINDVHNINNITFSKKVELNNKFKGQLNDIITSCSNLYVDYNNNLYCIIDNNYLEILEKAKDNEYFKDEIKKINSLFKICNNYNVNIIKANLN